jgi:hypothetical protein
MTRKASIFRFDPSVQAALENLSRILKRPMNQLVNEAVKAYVRQRGREVERDLEATLASLRAYREQDPDFDQAIAKFVAAETSPDAEDPAEGTVVFGDLVDGRLVTESGPVQTEIHKLLRG